MLRKFLLLALLCLSTRSAFSMQNSLYIEKLPAELQASILAMLASDNLLIGIKNIQNLYKVSKTFQNLISKPEFFNYLLTRLSGHKDIPKNFASLSKIYIACLLNFDPAIKYLKNNLIDIANVKKLLFECILLNLPDLITKKIISSLEKAGFDLNIHSDRYGYNMLTLSIKNYRPKIVKFLLTYYSVNVNFSQKDKVNKNAVQLALEVSDENKRIELLIILLSRPDLEVNQIIDKDCNSLLTKYVIENNNNFVNFILSHSSVNLNLKNNNKDTALMIAVKNQNPEMVNLLLSDFRTDVNQESKYAKPFVCACEILNFKIINSFLKHSKLAFNQRDSKGQNGLMALIEGYVSQNKQLEYSQICNWRKNYLEEDQIVTLYDLLIIIKKLLAHPDFDVNRKNSYGDSALSLAIENHLFTIISLLLDHPNININISKVNNTTGLSESLLELASNQLKNIQAWTKEFYAMQGVINALKEKTAK